MKIKFCGEFLVGPTNSQRFQFNWSGVGPGHCNFFKAPQVILMSSQELRTTVLNLTCSLKCFHKIIFLICYFQIFCSLPFSHPQRQSSTIIDSEEQWTWTHEIHRWWKIILFCGFKPLLSPSLCTRTQMYSNWLISIFTTFECLWFHFCFWHPVIQMVSTSRW